jgi:hypothetical protein
MFLVDYLGGLLAGTIKNPTSTKARLLFTALDALKAVLAKIDGRRAEASVRQSTGASVYPKDDFWSVQSDQKLLSKLLARVRDL